MSIALKPSEPEAMTDDECLKELSQVLATGLVRAMKRSEKYCKKRQISRDNCLDVPAEVSPHVLGP